MIVSALLIGFFTLNFGIIGEDPPRQFATVGQVCKCVDTGDCQCEAKECGCADCTGVANKPRQIVTKRYFTGYQMIRQCGPNGCRMVRVPTYSYVQVEE